MKHAALGLLLTTVGIMLILTWILRIKLSLVAAILGAIPIILAHLPRSTLEWGVALTAIGFLALVVGIAVNWNQRNKF